MSLRKTTLSGLGWTMFESLSSQVIVFLVYIVLARLLEPSDFGIIAVLLAFIAVLDTLVDGGLNSALIRKSKVSELEYSTVFFANLFFSFLVYCLLIVLAGPVAGYYKMPELVEIIPWAGLIIIINSFSYVQLTRFDRKLDFKTPSLISVIASIIGGTIAIIMALQGFGIWSILAFELIENSIATILIWLKAKWKPKFQFSIHDFKKLASFGYKLTAAEFLGSLYSNIFYMIIGRVFPPKILGFLSRSEQFARPMSGYITSTTLSVSFPVLSKVKNDQTVFKQTLSQFVRHSTNVSFLVFAGVAAMAKPIILILIGEKWAPSIIYAQLLCFPAMFYPIQLLNLDVLVIKGKSGLFLKIEILKKLILIPLVIVASFYGIYTLLVAIMCFTVIEFYTNTHYASKLANYSRIEQLKDIIPSFLFSATIFLIMYSITMVNIQNLWLLATIQLLTGIVAFMLLNNFFNIKENKEVINYVKQVVSMIHKAKF